MLAARRRLITQKLRAINGSHIELAFQRLQQLMQHEQRRIQKARALDGPFIGNCRASASGRLLCAEHQEFLR